MSDFSEPDDQDRHLEAFQQSLENLNERGGVFHSALLISGLIEPDLSPGWADAWYDVLDRWVAEVSPHLASAVADEERIARLAEFFCTDLGFRGAGQAFHHPQNSALTYVMSAREGLPITLSVLLSAMGERLGLDLFGVAAPGHFLTGTEVSGRRIYIDPFNECTILEHSEAIDLVQRVTNLPPALIESTLEPAAPRDIIVRMLNNLKVAYLRQNNLTQLLPTLTWMLVVDPDNATERRNRGVLNLRAGRKEEGARDLLRYLELDPRADDLDVIYDEARRAKKSREEGEEGPFD